MATQQSEECQIGETGFTTALGLGDVVDTPAVKGNPYSALVEIDGQLARISLSDGPSKIRLERRADVPQEGDNVRYADVQRPIVFGDVRCG
jgi:hypothetical protein